jgi:hypothetical protein
VHDAGWNEGGVAGAEDTLLAIDPLLDHSGDHEHNLSLIGVLVEIVTLAQIEIDVDHDKLLWRPVVGGSLRRLDVPSHLP